MPPPANGRARQVSQPGFLLHEHRPEEASLGDEVLAGLARPAKAIPPKFFYDETGSKLFEAICRLPEYPVTRAENALLQRQAAAIADRVGKDCALVEYGSGASLKSRVLIEALRPPLYVPIDISRTQLVQSSTRLAEDYPWLHIEAVWADYTGALVLPPAACRPGLRRVVYFSGSSIGNFTPDEAVAFLERARETAGREGRMLVAVDLKKPADKLHAAYTDSQGITARFNLNLLARVNRELDGNFDLEGFRHAAFYQERVGRIEMHLVAVSEQEVSVSGQKFRFFAGEALHTENSYKYHPEEFEALASRAGFTPDARWFDPERSLALHCLVV